MEPREVVAANAFTPEKLQAVLDVKDPFYVDGGECTSSDDDVVSADVSKIMSARGKKGRDASLRSSKSHLSHRKRLRFDEQSNCDQSNLDQSGGDEDLVESDEEEEGTLNYGFGN